MDFLDAIGVERVGAADDPFEIAAAGELAASFAEEGDGLDAVCRRDIDGFNDVGRVAAGGKDDEDIAAATEAFYPAGEDGFEAVVVCGARDVAGVVAGDGGERRAVFAEAAGELFAEVGGVGAASAITNGEKLVPVSEGFDDHPGSLSDATDVRGIGEEGIEGALGDFKIGAERAGDCFVVEMGGRLVSRHWSRIAGKKAFTTEAPRHREEQQNCGK